MSQRLTQTRRKYVVKMSSIHGKGLFAATDYGRDDYIDSYRGPRTQSDGPYVLWLDEEGFHFGIDGKNALRFVNHSREPNAIFYGEELFALRKINPGDEITFHYGDEWQD